MLGPEMIRRGYSKGYTVAVNVWTSEIGAFAVVYAFFVGSFAHKDLTRCELRNVTRTTTEDVGAMMFIIALSAIFSYGIVWERIPEMIAEFLLGVSGSNPYELLTIIVVFLILAGMFVDGAVLILMLTPIFLPIALKTGFDPVHFGLIFVLTITVGNMTPPVGAAMYAGCTILDCSIQEYMKESLSFFVGTIGTILILIIFPEITLYLPNLMFGK